jgi:hypothetical protein
MEWKKIHRSLRKFPLRNITRPRREEGKQKNTVEKICESCEKI